jgi:hypothetical protein
MFGSKGEGLLQPCTSSLEDNSKCRMMQKFRARDHNCPPSLYTSGYYINTPIASRICAIHLNAASVRITGWRSWRIGVVHHEIMSFKVAFFLFLCGIYSCTANNNTTTTMPPTTNTTNTTMMPTTNTTMMPVTTPKPGMYNRYFPSWLLHANY